MSIFKFRGIILLLALVFIGANVTRAQVPPGWLVAGSSPQDFDFSLDSSIPPNGRSALIAAKPGTVSRGFGTLMQEISAENYRGQHVRLSGYLKTADATRAQMWMRVDGPDHQVLSFDNMDSRPVTGTIDYCLRISPGSGWQGMGTRLQAGDGRHVGSPDRISSAAVTEAAGQHGLSAIRVPGLYWTFQLQPRSG